MRTSAREAPSKLSVPASLACLERLRQLVQRDRLLLFVPLDRIGDAGVVGGEVFAGAHQLEPFGVELRACLGLDLAELLAIRV